MSDPLTPVPTCADDPCVIGATPAPETVCGRDNLEDPLARTRALELENKKLRNQMLELQRQILSINTSIGVLRGVDASFDARITALETGTSGSTAELDALKARVTTNENGIATNLGFIQANDAKIVVINETALGVVTSPTEILDGVYLDGNPVQFPIYPTGSYILDNEGLVITDEFGIPLLSPPP